jgi:hypothetical protein
MHRYERHKLDAQIRNSIRALVRESDAQIRNSRRALVRGLDAQIRNIRRALVRELDAQITDRKDVSRMHRYETSDVL